MNQEPTANCNLELLHELFDSVIKSLWVDSDSNGLDSLSIPSPDSDSKSSQSPQSQGTDPIKAQLKKLKKVVGFLHEQLNERAAAVKFEWEESLAFAAASGVDNPMSPPVDQVTTFASYLESPSVFGTHDGSDLFPVPLARSPSQSFEEAHTNIHRDRYLSVSSVSSFSSAYGDQCLCSAHQKPQHQFSHLNTPTKQHSIPSAYQLDTASPKPPRGRSLISRSRKSYPPLPPLPSQPDVRSSPLHASTQVPGYLASTVSSRAASRVGESEPRPSSGSAASSPRLLRQRASMPEMKLKHSPQSRSSFQLKDSTPRQLRSGSALYAVNEDLYDQRSCSRQLRPGGPSLSMA